MDAIENSAGNDFLMQKKYRDRLELFYPVRDEKNCERTYQIINNIGGER